MRLEVSSRRKNPRPFRFRSVSPGPLPPHPKGSIPRPFPPRPTFQRKPAVWALQRPQDSRFARNVRTPERRQPKPGFGWV